MPVVQVNLMQGYDEETRVRLSKALTDTVRSVIAAPADGVTVILNEVPAASYMRGREAKRPGPALPDAKALVADYLQRMEDRDLAGAKALLADGFTMVFPGDAEFTSLEQLIDWAKPRYNWVKKRYDRWDSAPAEDGATVTCQGTLYGEFPDGTGFKDVRFTDWFLVADGKLQRQHVWNDLGELRRD